MAQEGGGSDEQRKTLQIFEKTLGCYIMESAQALSHREAATALESEIEAARNQMKLGYDDPSTGSFHEKSSVALRNLLRSSDDEATRKVPSPDPPRPTQPPLTP